MIYYMFIFGVILPTLLTVAIFITFVICWVKFNMKERLLQKRRKYFKFYYYPQKQTNSIQHNFGKQENIKNDNEKKSIIIHDENQNYFQKDDELLFQTNSKQTVFGENDFSKTAVNRFQEVTVEVNSKDLIQQTFHFSDTEECCSLHSKILSSITSGDSNILQSSNSMTSNNSSNCDCNYMRFIPIGQAKNRTNNSEPISKHESVIKNIKAVESQLHGTSNSAAV